MSRKFRYRRTSEIKMTNEARVLRRLRLDSGTKIKEVAKEIGKSEAYIRHIEHGRLDVPDKETIKKILLVYGATYRIYSAKCKVECSEDAYTELKNIIHKIPDEKVPLVLSLVRGVLSS
ncbi:helix-turn-helix transcriptional regulator [Halobacteriovorax sp. GB3]|uniref:helix-turn-helix domain-containing protein n=1 Tax=Halobacteriovorax sp. GB3 TaxID=2719615 RepID=UPI00235F90D5|nr:helix-turn-helix transcriptional regulator [Halobacteriovorax sp. GB3]MDD0851604.1 helix-turn-helix transcriptional regulator [Halobacteriovorax sp. GB3]